MKKERGILIYKAQGESLYDSLRKGRLVEILDEAVAWSIDIACQRLADIGYSQKMWKLKKLESMHQRRFLS